VAIQELSVMSLTFSSPDYSAIKILAIALFLLISGDWISEQKFFVTFVLL
jgi:hypothetical protein